MGVAKKKLMVVGNWAAIVKNKKVLIVKRDSQEILGAGTWSIPGGKSEKGKDCYKNLDREVLEESDLKIKNSKFLLHLAWPRKDDWVMGFFWLADYKSGQVKLNREHTNYKWVSKKEFKNIKTTKMVRRILEEVFKNIK